LLVVFGLLALLVGCSTPTDYVVVPEESEPGPPKAEPARNSGSDTYTVKPGDSLYLISFATGADWREIARLNAITPPYRIFPGQVLRLRMLRPGSHARVAQAPSSGAAVVRAAPDSALVTPVQPAKPPTNPTLRTDVSQPPVAKSSAVVATPVPPAPVARAPAPVRPAASPVVAVRPVTPVPVRAPKPGAWQWPASGKLSGRFSAGAQPHKGIDLDGNLGDPVHAANSGVVVYAGSGVRGYGNLLIIKHDEVFLSAYAHNSKLLVKEGDAVRAGQTIAEIGDSGTDRVKLHFEVRRKGSPVDPTKILPRR
jgi:lipoprotein NlpD